MGIDLASVPIASTTRRPPSTVDDEIDSEMDDFSTHFSSSSIDTQIETPVETSTSQPSDSTTQPAAAPAAAPVRRRRRKPKKSFINKNAIPDSILTDPAIQSAISTLPPSYNFEIPKTIHRLRCHSPPPSTVSLQMPEGLLMYSCLISDILTRFTSATSVIILGDVTYGACCVDDLGAKAIESDYLIHYGHSCLVPLTETVLPTLYVFVEITTDVRHLTSCFLSSFTGSHVHIMGTVQFRTAIIESHTILQNSYTATIPQAKPLSPGEVLGCTSPKNLYSDNLPSSSQCMLFIADGRFHLEAAMIANPKLKAYRYDPYSKILTVEGYAFEKMKGLRVEAIRKARKAKVFGVILGTLGRQGNPRILRRVKNLLNENGKESFIVLLSEIMPQKLEMMPQADAWVQIACPRLSVDWGHFFKKPVLSTYELYVLLGEAEMKEGEYPMDFYSKGDDNYWGNFGADNDKRRYND
ncbi:hypothetical protein TrVE_jg9843 [Triparma verrucosa]|uniref:2-(3-amino-3-carboxypropyl)histidine synthase subunit 1 n=1 Tax=Triparma verrucosa TaxID=1606542 RepID=A0A9W7KUN1_9STRA|nr:hypothetical protein TrVE_jg9843 [Triparma verrucosa]